MSASESTLRPSFKKLASCSIMALGNSSESPILSSSATVRSPSLDWSLLKEPHGGRLRRRPSSFTHLRGHYPVYPSLALGLPRRATCLGFSQSVVLVTRARLLRPPRVVCSPLVCK